LAETIVKAYLNHDKYPVKDVLEPVKKLGPRGETTAIFSRGFAVGKHVCMIGHETNCTCETWRSMLMQNDNKTRTVMWCPEMLAVLRNAGYVPGDFILMQESLTLSEMTEVVTRTAVVKAKKQDAVLEGGWHVRKPSGKKSQCTAKFACFNSKCTAGDLPGNLPKVTVKGQFWVTPDNDPDDENGKWRKQTFNFHINKQCVLANFNPKLYRFPKVPTKMPLDANLTEEEKYASGLLFER
jgi:hypothetical protein